jgi:glycosyltransferase involved in cell wall biosynthesis
MALEVPAVVSPIGVNNKIIDHGTNGFVASTDDDWIDVITELVRSVELRRRIGRAGRQTVIDEYSVEANKQKYLESVSK